jgi:hypothetical protein
VTGSAETSAFDIAKLRQDIARGRRLLRITTHAQLEAFKDGLLLADLRYVFERGEVIEIYPDDRRGLLFANSLEHGLPVHIVVEDTPAEGVVVTAYVPDKSKWIANRKRRKTGRKK